MPTYTIRNIATGEEKDEFFTSYSAKEEWLAANPEYDSIIRTAPGLHSGAGLGLRKIDNGFKDLLGVMKKNNPRSTIET